VDRASSAQDCFFRQIQKAPSAGLFSFPDGASGHPDFGGCQDKRAGVFRYIFDVIVCDNRNVPENLMKMYLQIRLAVLVLLSTVIVPSTRAECVGEQKAVLVTGASSGIGRAIAESLARDCYFVYAGARKQQDLDALDAIDNIHSVRLDVTVQSEIDRTVQEVRAAGRGLYALINNAGVLITGPSAEVDVEQVQWLFDVNVFGVYRVTQAFVPLIIENRGRILNIGSIAGNIGIRFLGPYSMSKHAIEAYTDALAAELAPFGVHVSVVAPGDYVSNIWASDIAQARMSEVVSADSPYAKEYQAWIDFVANMELKEPDEVAETVLGALSADTPSRRYLVVPNEGEMAWVMGSAVERLAELNGDHAHSYSEAELARMLREALADQTLPRE
jgi:NAD(P)-dependent dehydrogenase (short-subunit alcohol dehydrogenase family)